MKRTEYSMVVVTMILAAVMMTATKSRAGDMKLNPNSLQHLHACKIEVSEPKEGSRCYQGLPCKIRWDSKSTWDKHRTVWLSVNMSSPQSLQGGGYPVKNTGEYSYTPDPAETLGVYYVEIKTGEGQCRGKSGNFTLLRKAKDLGNIGIKPKRK